MPSATRVTKKPTTSQPRVMTAGPPVFIANAKSVRQPDRIEMIVNETAKLENVRIPRRSSWAYPSWWSRRCPIPAIPTSIRCDVTVRRDARDVAPRREQ